MPTKKRIVVPGAIAHIMARGIDGMVIFKDDDDRSYFLHLLESAISKTGYLCYGWVLMNNHYHLIMRCSDRSLDDLMRSMNSRYARYYNMKYKRRGYLFQDRFKSIITQDQNYLEELIRYAHLNPIRAGICKSMEELDAYRWCGHGVLMGKTTCLFQTTDAVLRRFGSTDSSSRENYRKFIAEGASTIKDDWIVQTVRESNRGIERKERPSCWVIGDQEFVMSVMRKNEQRLRTRSALHEKWSIEDVFRRVAAEQGLELDALKRRSRMSKVSAGRKRGAYICCRVLGYRIEEVAAYLKISGPAVSSAIAGAGELVSKRYIDKVIKLPG